MLCERNTLPYRNDITETAHAVVSNSSKTIEQPFSSRFVEAFLSSLKRLFHSQTASLSHKTKVDLTNIHVSKDQDQDKDDIDLEKTVHTVQHRFGGKLQKVALFALLTSFVGYEFFDSQTVSTPKVGPTTGGDPDEAFGIALAPMLRQHINRALLSSPNITSSNYSISATEEIAFSESFNTWDVFPYADQGRLVVSTTSPLPPGVNLVQSPMQIVSSIAIGSSGINSIAATNNALYVAQPGGTVQVFNIETISNPYLTYIINNGGNMIVLDMKIIGNHLYCAGVNNIIRIFNISQPSSPIAQGEISIPGISVSRIASTGIDKQLGCLTSQGQFFCIDASDSLNPIITGNFTLGSTATSITTSPGYYYIVTNSGLSIINTTESSSPTLCGFLPLIGINDLKYSNGFCYAVSSNRLLIIDVKNQTNPVLINNIYYSGDSLIGLLPPFDGGMYYISYNGMGIFDLSNQTNPLISASAIFLEANSGRLTALLDEYVIFRSIGKINFATRSDSFSFSGTPKGGSQGVYRPSLTATTLSGQVINDTKTFELNILPAVTPSSPIPNQIAVVGQVFNAIINPKAFMQAIAIPLRYSLECASESSLSSSISLNPVSAQFSGIPIESDVGSTTCAIRAIDSYGASGMSSAFNISVFYGPTLIFVPNQIAIIGQPFSLKLAATSKDTSSVFRFTVSSLPASFTLEGNTISGTPRTSDLGTYPISVTATDQNGISSTKSFTFNVVIPGVPVFLNPLSSQTLFVGVEFSIAIPLGAAVNPNNPNTAITYSASLSDGSSLPSWMLFDGTKFEGTPPKTTILFNDVVFPIVLTATQKLPSGEKATASTVFSITVSGTSVAKTTATILGPLLSVAGVLWAARICLYNRMADNARFISCVNKINRTVCCCLGKETTFYQSNELFFERQSLEYTFKTRRSEIVSFKTLYNTQPYPDGYGALPHWLNLHYDGDTKTVKISTEYVPDLVGIDSIKIFAIDQDGYNLEEVTFTKADSDENNFSRFCKTPSENIKKFKFFGAHRTPIAQPSWLQYNKRFNKIIVKDAPSLKEIEPLTIFILGQGNEILETIYINKTPKKKPIIVAEESELEEDVPLLASAAESKSPPSIELTELKKDFSAAPSVLVGKGDGTRYEVLD